MLPEKNEKEKIFNNFLVEVENLIKMLEMNEKIAIHGNQIKVCIKNLSLNKSY